MARPLRPLIKDGWYHVTARGNRRQNIYRQDRDRRHLLELLGEMVERHAIEVHAYVLMWLNCRGLLQSSLAHRSSLCTRARRLLAQTSAP